MKKYKIIFHFCLFHSIEPEENSKLTIFFSNEYCCFSGTLYDHNKQKQKFCRNSILNSCLRICKAVSIFRSIFNFDHFMTFSMIFDIFNKN